jgi:polysaccharide biosynthesis/export protein
MRIRVRRPRWRSTAAHCSVLLGSIVLSQAALAEYHLAPGDTVEVAAYGLPDQHYRALVQLDGSISLPGVGAVVVGGMTQAQLQQRMETLLPTRIFRYRTPDGQEHPVVLKPADVTATIAEYRPVYISGDVLTPGQQPFRPLMTVRQLVAMAGGYSLLRSRAQQGAADPAELQREYQAASIEYAKEFYHSLRLQAELQNKATFQQQTPQDASVTSSLGSSIVKSESESLRVAQDDFKAEQAFLENVIKKADAQLGVLRTQEQEEAKGVQSDAEDLDRLGRLFSAGNSTSARITDARRAMLLSSTRHLQTLVEVMRLEHQQEGDRRQLDRLASQRKAKLLADLNDSNVRLAVLAATVRSARQRLQPVGAGGGPLLVDPDKVKPEIVIVRKIEKQWSRMAVDPDAEVEPGDVVEVTLRTPAIPTQ